MVAFFQIISIGGYLLKSEKETIERTKAWASLGITKATYADEKQLWTMNMLITKHYVLLGVTLERPTW